MRPDVPGRTWIMGVAWVAGGLVIGACGGAWRAPPPEHCPDRGRALSLTLRELAASGDVEGPRGVVAGFDPDQDAACPSGGVASRVRCHLARATVEVTSRCEASGWLFTVYLPELSDHVHSVRVSRAASGDLGVEMSSEN
jgi:hypothetical protein